MLIRPIFVLVEAIQSNAELFGESASPSAHTYDGHQPALERRQSNQSIMSQMSGHIDLSITTITASKYSQYMYCGIEYSSHVHQSHSIFDKHWFKYEE